MTVLKRASALLIVGLAMPAVGEQTPADNSERTLNDKEKEERASQDIETMRDSFAAISKLVEEARNERDALRLNCVNESKNSVGGLVKVAEIALDELRAALKERQTEVVEHEFQKITIATTKVGELKTKANQCVGMLAFYDGDVQVEFKDDNKDTPNLDPTKPTPPLPVEFRPPPASPIK